MTLKRSDILRKRPDADYASVPVRKEAKPAKGPRRKLCSCCRVSFVPMTPMGRACSIDCAIKLAVKVREAATRKDDRARKQAIKTRSDHMKDAQTAFNAWVRERDAQQPCICCGRIKTSVEGLRSHGWDSGHYRSVGSAPHLRFHEDNAHRQLVYCNRDGSGRAVDYRIGLIARIGIERVEALESDNEARKYTVEQLIEIKTHYRAKLRALTNSGNRP